MQNEVRLEEVKEMGTGNMCEREKKNGRRGSKRIGTERETWKKGKAKKEERDGKRERVASQRSRTAPFPGLILPPCKDSYSDYTPSVPLI